MTTPSDNGPERALRRAIVRLSSSDIRAAREVATDDQGRFVFIDLPPGRYTLTALRPGYLTMAYGAKRLKGAGTPITLADGQRELSLRVSLPRGGVITGTITDSTGRPIANAGVSILERTAAGSVVRLDQAGGAVTDDRGVYRVFGLPAGSFIVMVQGADQLNNAARQTTAADLQWALQQRPAGASVGYASPPPVGQTVAFSPVYFPGTVDPQSAAPVNVGTGKEVAGVSFAIQFVPMVRVSGTLTRSDGRPAAGVTLMLQPEQPEGMQFAIAPRGIRGQATASATGDFEFRSVATGRYAITTRLGTQAGTLWSKDAVTVTGQDVTGLSIVMKPAVTVSGRVLVDDPAGTTVDLTRAAVQLSAVPSGAAGSLLRVDPGADGAFVIQGAIPGSHRLSADASAAGLSPGGRPWVTKAVTIGGRDVFDRYFEIQPGGNIEDVVITLTSRIASLSGKLIDGQGKVAPEFFVLLIPVDRALWVARLERSPKQARPANDGTFTFENVPPGDYYLAASTDVDPRDLTSADFLDQFIPSAIKITIAEGEKKVQDLKIGG